MLRLVLSDVDNTLIPLGEEHVSRRAVDAIHALMDTGVRFGLATGREAFELERMFAGAAECYSTAIMANGKRICVDGGLRKCTLLDHAALERLEDLLEAQPDAFLTVNEFDEVPSPRPFWCVGMTRSQMEWFERLVNIHGELCDRLPGFPVISASIACLGSQERLDELLDEARAMVPEFDYLQPCENWCDIVPHGFNKGVALGALLQELGIEANEVLYFGDSDNDVSILGAVGMPVAMANASEKATTAARWHVGPCEGDGVARALEELVGALANGGEVPPRTWRR